MKSIPPTFLLGALLGVAMANPAMAQAHYPPGAFPLESLTSMPAYPGVYYSQMFVNYSGDVNLDRNLLRGRVPAGLDLQQNVFSASSVVMWQTGEKFLGADYGVSVLLPFQNNNLGTAVELGLLQARTQQSTGMGLGDIYISPLMLGWHGDRHDILFSYGIDIPTGRFDVNADDNIGRGFYTHQLELGGRYFVDEERSWSLNAVGTFEANTSNARLNPGNYFTLDWGIKKKLDPQWTIGLTGYNTRQLTPISGLPAGLLSNFTNSADAIGGEVSVVLPEANFLTMTAKFSHEYNSYGRFGGNIASLTFSVPIHMDLPSAPPPVPETATPPETSPAPAQP